MVSLFTEKELKESYTIDDIIEDDGSVRAILEDYEYYEKNFDFSILNLDEDVELTKQDKKFLYEDMRKELFKYIRIDVKQNLSLQDDELFITDMDDLNLTAVSSFDEESYDAETLKLLRPYIYDAYVKLYNLEFGTDYKNVYNKETTFTNDSANDTNDDGIFTALNADKAKAKSEGYFADDFATLKQLINHSEAPSKLVEIKNENNSKRFVSSDGNSYAFFYLTKLSDEYVPYANAEEMLKDYADRMHISLKDCGFNFPLMRIKNKVTEDVFFVTGLNKNAIYVANGIVSFNDLCEYYIFTDKKPCGKK